MSDFQTQVNTQPAPGVEGDFCSKNPRFNVLAGQGALVAGPVGVTVGRFAWATYYSVDNDEAPASVANTGLGAPTGFVGRSLQALITTYLASASMVIPQGFGLTLFSGGDFWMKNAGSGYAAPGMKAYASLADGSVTFAATGAPTKTGALTGAVTQGTFSVTGSIADNLLKVTAVGSGSIKNGSTISGTDISTGSQIVAQVLPLITGEALGGIGRYIVSIAEQSAASTTVSGTYGILTVTVAPSGTLGVGQSLTNGTSAVVGTQITQLGTGAGGTGTYFLNNNTAVSSTADIQFATNVETKWYAMSGGAAGELVKTSDHALG